jgi:hypothetical protein
MREITLLIAVLVFLIVVAGVVALNLSARGTLARMTPAARKTYKARKWSDMTYW